MTSEFIPASMNAVELYSEFRQQLETLKADSNALVFDYASPKGNKEARSHVYSLRKVGAALEKARKAAKADALEYGRLVDFKAKEVDAEISALIEVHDKPLREIEEREQSRIADIKLRMLVLDAHKMCDQNSTAAQWSEMLLCVEAFAIDASLGEFMATAAIAKDKAVGELKTKLAERQQYEAEQAELARLRAEAAENERKAREAKIAEEAAANAKREAEAIAERQRLAVAREQQQREQAAQEAARQQELALERAKREKAEAEQRAANAEREAKAKAERDLAAKLAAEKAEAEEREANKKHCARINNAAVDALVAGGIDPEVAKLAITLIAQRKIPSVSIEY